jgi:hypothetical protein
MGLATQRTLIDTELTTELQILRPAFILIGENADEPQPSNEPWIRMSITLLDIFYPCLGSDVKAQYDAIFNVQIFSPLAIGSGDVSLIADQVRGILRGSSLIGIEFLNFDVATGSIEADWYGLLMRCNYRAND